MLLTGLDWQIVSAVDEQFGADRARADETTSYCREILGGLERLDEVWDSIVRPTPRIVPVLEGVPKKKQKKKKDFKKRWWNKKV